MRRPWTKLRQDERGTVAPTVALSLVALIATGGLAFDYARLATMKTELQDAADQAALAGASQLDGQPNAVKRAVAAAQGLLVNRTLLSNDSCGTAVETGVTNSACTTNTSGSSARIYFFSTKVDAEAGTNGVDASTATDASAHFIKVAVVARKANYTLTPIVGALSSGNAGAEAVAGLGSAICKTPPVMICNPDEPLTNTSPGGNPNYPFNSAGYVGRGLKLVSVGNGNGAWAPGNFGYLQNNGSTGLGQIPELKADLGWTSPPGDCSPLSGVNTKPGASTPVTGALNTRFDIYDNTSNGNGASCISGGSCPPALNVVKDVSRPGNSSNCGYSNNGQPWQLPTNYYGSGTATVSSATAALATTVTPSTMGHPRDMCHMVSSGTAGACKAALGDGLWDRDAYFRTNYRRTAGTYWTGGSSAGSWQANTGLPATATRYAVYNWEMSHIDQTIDGVTVSASRVVSGNGANVMTSYGKAQCGVGTIPNATTPDRRRISMAVANCTYNSVNGNSPNVPVITFVDMFLVEPSLNRTMTNAGDVYAEIIGATPVGAGQTAGQVIRRDKPYLVR